MFARKQISVNVPSVSREVANAKANLKQKGWSYRAAAPHLGVCYQHLAQVLTGRRESRALLQRIHQLPPRES